ncbi:hypothetical protein DPX16_2654 [Anabarilius grahami]|uniref:Uncharacterized protein n=1 Tax=Anabarilius grahami TaxID=495550 RepID=A0A3N0Y4W0_ANAGA|nr:hypothetical protein DPX16_2654 [Anabarilius grahami]
MKLIFGLMLLKTAACVEQNCWFNQGGPCYAALGDKLNLLMMVPDGSRYELKIQKSLSSTEKDPDCSVKNGRIKENECDLFNDRPEVSVYNGILIINGVIGADSGNYRLYLINFDGTTTYTNLQVIVEVSVVFVLVWCFQMMFLLGLLGGFHIYMRHTSGKVKDLHIPALKSADLAFYNVPVTDRRASVLEKRQPDVHVN